MSTLKTTAVGTTIAAIFTTITACSGGGASNERPATTLPPGDLDSQAIQDGGQYLVLGDINLPTAYTASNTKLLSTGVNTFKEIKGSGNEFDAAAIEGFDVIGNDNKFFADDGVNIRGFITGSGTEIDTPTGVAGFNEIPVGGLTINANDISFSKDTDNSEGNGRTTINYSGHTEVGGSVGPMTDFNISGTNATLDVKGSISCDATLYSEQPAIVAVSYNDQPATNVALSGAVKSNVAQLGLNCH